MLGLVEEVNGTPGSASIIEMMEYDLVWLFLLVTGVGSSGFSYPLLLLERVSGSWYTGWKYKEEEERKAIFTCFYGWRVINYIP